MNPNSMMAWWPEIANLSSIKAPRTIIVPVGWESLASILDGDWSGLEAKMPEIEAAVWKIGVPLFMRTDLISGKHHWHESCYLWDVIRLRRHIFGLAEASAMADLGSEALVFRQLLRPSPGFYAFGGRLPIGVERRYFVRDGVIQCHHPYWPADSIRKPDRRNWESILAANSIEDQEEVGLLSDWAGQISQAIEGFWSVDFYRDAEDHWWFIDMARGEESWHTSGCRWLEMSK